MAKTTSASSGDADRTFGLFDTPEGAQLEDDTPPNQSPEGSEGVPESADGFPESASPEGATGTGEGDTREPKHDPSRYEFWQRQAALLKDELDQIKPLIPIARYIQDNKHILQTVQADLQQKQAGPVAPPKAPTAPQQPADYSEEAAYNDPTSSSFKYRVALEKHNGAQIQYLIQMQEYERAQRERGVIEEQKRQEQYQKMIQFRDQVMTTYRVGQDEANAFVDWYVNPQFTVDQAFQLFRMNRGVPRQTRAPQPAKGREGGPPPPGMTPAFDTNPEPDQGTITDPGALFSDDLMEKYRQRRGIPTQPPKR